MNLYSKPEEGHYAPYYSGYIGLVGDNDVISMLRMGSFEMLVFMENLSDDRWDYSYAEGKWTIKQAIMHMIDAERIFAYRALRIARNDKTALPGFEQDDYVANADLSDRTPDSIITEYKAVREASLALLEGLDDQARKRMGTASGFPFTVEALAYIIAGHEIHHMELFKSKYI